MLSSQERNSYTNSFTICSGATDQHCWELRLTQVITHAVSHPRSLRLESFAGTVKRSCILPKQKLKCIYTFTFLDIVAVFSTKASSLAVSKQDHEFKSILVMKTNWRPLKENLSWLSGIITVFISHVKWHAKYIQCKQSCQICDLYWQN